MERTVLGWSDALARAAACAAMFAAVVVAIGESRASTPAPAVEGAPAETSGDATPPNGRIQGSAIVRRNVPVIGAVVTARRAGEPSRVSVTTTDERGAFRFEGLPDGRYRCEFAHDGFATVVKDDVDLRAPFRAVVEITMAPGPVGLAPPPAPVITRRGSPPAGLRGVVRDRQGKGSGEVRVRLTREDGSEDPRESVTSAGGEFAFDELTPGRWHLEIQGAGLLPVRTILPLSVATSLAAVLVPQPAGHALAVEDLLPREEPIPPR